MKRRCGIAGAWLGLLLASSSVHGVDYPARPIRLVVPFPPGAGADVVARMVAQPMSQRLGQPLVVDNRSGAAGTIGASIVARAPPDGYTMLLVTATFAISAAFYKDLPYNAVADFSGIGRIATGPVAVVVHPSVHAASLKELIALARANPAKLNYASGGQGGINHLGAEMLKSATGINVVEVPYKGGGPALTGLLAGEAQMMVATLGSCLSLVRAGKLKALALGSKTRTKLMPELPTVIEAGVAGYDAETWYAVIGPRGIPTHTRQLLNAALVASVRSREVEEQLGATGFEASPTGAEEFSAYLKGEVTKWARAIKAAGIVRM